MDFIFDVLTRTLSVDTSNAQPWGADLRAMLNRYGQRVDLRGVEMRLTVTADGETVADISLPPPGVRYRQTDQDVLATTRVSWQPDQEIVATAWLRTARGEEMTAEATLTAPRPPQPYPSWTWASGAWTPPGPYPTDGGKYVWDEDAGEWVAA